MGTIPANTSGPAKVSQKSALNPMPTSGTTTVLERDEYLGPVRRACIRITEVASLCAASSDTS